MSHGTVFMPKPQQAFRVCLQTNSLSGHMVKTKPNQTKPNQNKTKQNKTKKNQTKPKQNRKRHSSLELQGTAFISLFPFLLGGGT